MTTMPPTVRWTFTSLVTGEVWVLPRNPDSMTSPHPSRQLSFARGAAATRARTNVEPSSGTEWQFGGPLRDLDHHDRLAAWAHQPGVVRITDHLGRSFEGVFTGYELTETPASRARSFRGTYQMKVMLLRELPPTPQTPA